MVHRPTEDSARIKIEHDGQIPPSLGRPHVGHVRAPVPIGAIRGELAIQMVRGNRQSMTTAGNQPPALARTNTQAGFAHQSSNSVSTTSMPHGRQLGLDSAMSIDPIHLVVDGSDLLAQTPIRYFSRRGRPLLPGRETAARYLQQPAHRCYGIATGQRLYGAKLHFVGCEKTASALFSTSRYMVTCPTAAVSDEAPRSRSLLAVARKGIVTSLRILTLPFAQHAFSARRLGYMTKRHTGKHLVYRLAFEGFRKASSGLGHEHSRRWALSTSSQCPLSPGQTTRRQTTQGTAAGLGLWRCHHEVRRA